jgi:hypothetical protein
MSYQRCGIAARAKQQHLSSGRLYVDVGIGHGLGAAIDVIGAPTTSATQRPPNQLRDNRSRRQCIVSLARPNFFLDLKRTHAQYAKSPKDFRYDAPNPSSRALNSSLGLPSTMKRSWKGVYAACRQSKIWRVRFSHAHIMKTASIKACANQASGPCRR